ncbi:MAG TPA: hypothetical protein VMF86_16315 [Stellaceae bacterium]|nr:hypothetical protein [Stellaceae bacterium]
MTRRFVIAVDGLDESENDRLRGYLESRGQWWNWISNFWLFVTDDPTVAAEDLRDYVGSINNLARSIILEFDEDVTWAGKGPHRNEKDMFRWLHTAWSKESVSG